MPNAADSLADSASFLHLLAEANRTTESVDFAAAYSDIVDCFLVLNAVLNTDSPSLHTDGKASSVDRTLVSSVALITSDGFSLYSRWALDRVFPDAYLSDVRKALLCVGFGWNAVLAGDIGDIPQSIEDEWFVHKILPGDAADREQA